MSGWLKQLLAVAIGGAATGAMTMLASGNAKQIGMAAVAGALVAIGHLNVSAPKDQPK